MTKWLIPWVDLAHIRLSETSAGSDGMHRSWIMYMPQGTFKHPEYGGLDFTPAKLAEFKAKFDSKVRGIDIALDCDHKTGEAPGWIEQMQLRDGSDGQPAGLYALIRWTKLGEKLIKDQLYKYFSPEFGTHFDEATGKKISNVPLGGALTNRPFMKSMTEVALSERRAAQRAAHGTGRASRGSRGEQMPVDYLDDGDEEAFELADASASNEEDYADGEGDDADSADDSPADSGADLHGAFDGSHSHGKYGKHSHDGDGDHSDAPLKASKQMSERRGGSGPRTLAEFRTAYAEHARQLAELREAKYLTDVRATMAAFDQTFKFSESSAPVLDPKTGKTLSERDAKVTPSRRLRTRYERFLLSDEARNLSDTARAEVLELVKLAYQHGAVVCAWCVVGIVGRGAISHGMDQHHPVDQRAGVSQRHHADPGQQRQL
jgi:hypothetical protein